MITFKQARNKAQEWIDSANARSIEVEGLRDKLTPNERKICRIPKQHPDAYLLALSEHHREGEWGWLLFYRTRKEYERGEFWDFEVESAPLLVDRKSGNLHVTGTSHRPEYYIRNLEKTGDPHKRPTP